MARQALGGRPRAGRAGPRRRVAIVGGGPGGLASAMLAAEAGAEVTLFERQDGIGGRSGAIEADTGAGRFRFDIGPTFFLYPTLLAEIFAACGRRLEDYVELIRLDTHYDLQFERDTRLSIRSDLPGLVREIAQLSPEDATHVAAFVDENRRKFDRFRTVLSQEFGGPAALLTPAMLRALPLLRPLSSVDDDLARHFKDPRVRLAFSFQSKYLGMSPYRCPSLFTILAFMEHEFGIYHPRGGTVAVMRAMERVARELGVRFECGRAVDEVTVADGRATGVVVGGRRHDADAVVLNADFAHAMTTLVPDSARRRWTDARIATKRFSCSAFMMYLGLEGGLPDTAHHTIFLSENYRENFAEIEAARAPPAHPSFYVQNACRTDPGQAPPGHSTLYVLIPVGNRDPDHPIVWDDALRARYRALAFARLADAGMPDLERRVVFERIVTPTAWEEEFGVHRGAVFNLTHNIGQMLHRRPHNRFEDVDGVYIVGGGTHPGSGLPVIFEGARISMRLMARDLGLPGHSAALPDAAGSGASEAAIASRASSADGGRDGERQDEMAGELA